MVRRHRLLPVLAGLLLVALVGFGLAQVTTFPRVRLSGRTGTLASITTSGQLAITTATPTAQAQADAATSTFPRVRVSDGSTENLLAVNTSGQVHVTCDTCGTSLTSSSNGNFAGLGATAKSSDALFLTNTTGPGLLITPGTASNTRMPVIITTAAGACTTVFDTVGALHTVTSIAASGSQVCTLDATGALTNFVDGLTGIPTMIEGNSDVNGSTFTARSPIANSSFNYLVVDGALPFAYTWGVDYNGRMLFGASAMAAPTGAPVGSVTINNGGSGCVSAPTVTGSGGGCSRQPTFTAAIGGGAVTSVVVATGGLNCTSAPALGISGGSCSGVVLTANLLDVALARNAAGRLEVNTGIPGTFADLTTRGHGIGIDPNGQNVIAFKNFLFTNIATVLTANGQIGYCSDCTIANPCAGSGTGAIAKRLNGVNVCN